ncbi:MULTISPECIES: hypothetical protein [unclassified Streptomyces]|uniref:hypothetical protein n=1 Tax=unclassified Streptomyces TaxID=2593676 RepID=UPI002DDB70BA|nr:hypothetical protein [Streptomyces sp. NBC_01795]WSA94744.1 hypothetical protein OIE63_26645 [Streptomyces sp. NBC_01795]WSS41420.1 hypothetical protein OG220_13000 [Streptomyces sp. NBC_01187]
MTHNAPLSPRPLSHLPEARRSVMTAGALREHGITAAMAEERCRPGGPWRMLLPGVCLLHAGEPTSEERLRAALLYAVAPRGSRTDPDGVPPGIPPGAMITGLAALALHCFNAVPSLLSLDRLDVLVPRGRRPRSTGCVRIVRTQTLPEPEEITGLPVAPVPRALADAVAALEDAVMVRRLLTESVRGGHCEPQPVLHELARARLLGRPHVTDAVDGLLAEGRALAEGRLYDMVFQHGLPDPCWNVELRVPGGPGLGGVDAYWPDHAVALEIDARPAQADDEETWGTYARKREALERLGVTVVYVTQTKLRDSLAQQAAVVRTALMTSAEREPASLVSVRPR